MHSENAPFPSRGNESNEALRCHKPPNISVPAAFAVRSADFVSNDRCPGRRVVFSEPDRLSRKPRNSTNEVRRIRLADPSRRPVAKDAPPYGRRITRTRHSMSTLRDQAALVTGSSRGIGAAIAKLYAQRGANIRWCGNSRGKVCLTFAKGRKRFPLYLIFMA
jgi:hypothetical protein